VNHRRRRRSARGREIQSAGMVQTRQTLSSQAAAHAPFLRAPEASRSIFVVMFAAACAPLGAGVVLFGWRALAVAGLSVGGCVLTETAYYRVTRTPALLGRSHAALTGLLLALTLPAFVPWYVPLTGAVFAIIVGKAIFGGMGHFLWQPALVGRLAVGVIFAPPLLPIDLLNPQQWPVLAVNRVILGDVRQTRSVRAVRDWQRTPAPPQADAFKTRRPREMLRELTGPGEARPASIVDTLRRMPPVRDLLLGAHGGDIGETCVLVILVAGLYLVYRNYVRGFLPGMFILAAVVTAAIAPVRAGQGQSWKWLPIASEGLDVGFSYVAYHLTCGEIMLAAWFLATEMTSRPVTAPAQAIFAAGCGATAVLLRLYTPLAIPAYAAVLGWNTFTPVLDVIRPRVLGQKRFWQRWREPRPAE